MKGMWKFQFRDDQTDFLKGAMKYLIEWHTLSEQDARCLPIDKFAHARSKEHAQEILDYLQQVTE